MADSILTVKGDPNRLPEGFVIYSQQEAVNEIKTIILRPGYHMTVEYSLGEGVRQKDLSANLTSEDIKFIDGLFARVAAETDKAGALQVVESQQSAEI